MDRFSNKQFEKQTIYEIFRACRLCGAGGGYKMPIIQNVVDLDDTDVELKQKIRECVQVEVHSDDKMPPLICELCIDKINDFYEFLEMCRQTNERTRLRLGLPPQKTVQLKNEPEEDNCILGVTEPIRDEDSEDEPLSQQPPKKTKSNKAKKTPEVVIRKCNVKIETSAMVAGKMKPAPASKQKPVIKTKDLKMKRRSPTPPPPKRITRQQDEDVKSIRSKNDKSNKNSEKDRRSTPKGILKCSTKKDFQSDDVHELLTPRKKRPSEPVKTPPSKKVKITAPTKARAQSPKPNVACRVCAVAVRGSAALASHMRTHMPTYTNPRLACNACGEWFTNSDEAGCHHKSHRNNPYRCERCDNTFKIYAAYNDHFSREPCEMFDVVPDIKCDECWYEFPTQHLYLQHRCPGRDGRRGGKCGKCRKSYTLMKNLIKHEASCTYRRKGEVYIDPTIQKQLRKFEIRVAKCDPLLKTTSNGHYDVALVPSTYGVDPSRVYPYIRIKRELHDSMVNIHYDAMDYVHWDSDYSSDFSDTDKPKARRVDSLSTLTLKVIFSRRCLGKIPRKRRCKPVVKHEDAFDTMMNNDGDTSIKRNIDNIIAGLDSAWDDDDDNMGDSQDDTASLSILDTNELSEGEVVKKDSVKMDAAEKDEDFEVAGDSKPKDDDDTDNSKDGKGDTFDKFRESEDGDVFDKLKESEENAEGVDKEIKLDKETEDTTVKDGCKSPTITQNDEAIARRPESPTYTQDFDGITEKDGEKGDDFSGQDENYKKPDDNTDEAGSNDVHSLLETKIEQNKESDENEQKLCEPLENDKQTKTGDETNVASAENSDTLQNNVGTVITEHKNAISSEVSDKSSEDNSNLVNNDKVQGNGVISRKHDSEVYDKELMDAIDAQITANDNNSRSKLEVETSTDNDRIGGDKEVRDLDLNHTDLDNISDEEFNFDV